MAESSTGSATVPHGDPSSPASQSQSQFQEIHSGNGNGNRNGDEDIDSLPSTETDDSEDQLDESDAEREWRESLQQLELILTMVLVPYIGKYFGRKAAYWGECPGSRGVERGAGG